MRFAYLDAGSGALLIQMIVGGAAGVAAYFRFRWRRLTKREVEASGEGAPESEPVGAGE